MQFLKKAQAAYQVRFVWCHVMKEDTFVSLLLTKSIQCFIILLQPVLILFAV